MSKIDAHHAVAASSGRYDAVSASASTPSVVTSDGYTVALTSGASAASAVAYLALLDAFARVLERRVVCDHMPLLRRLFADGVCKREVTLPQYIAQASMLIFVAPIEVTHAAHRADASTLLVAHSPVLIAAAAAAGGSASSAIHVFEHLLARLRTKHFTLLVQFFEEFCQQREDALCAFVRSARSAIALLPWERAPLARSHSFDCVEPLPMPTPPSPRVLPSAKSAQNHAERSTTTPTAASTHSQRKRGRAEPMEPVVTTNKQIRATSARTTMATTSTTTVQTTTGDYAWRSSSGDEDSGSEMDADDAEAEPRLQDARSAARRKRNEAMCTLKLQLISQVREYEDRAPWTRVFRDLPLPFDEQDAPALAARLRRFWKRYARAVWERHFWTPLSEDAQTREHQQRKTRQRQASITFGRIIHAAYATFGVRFFYRLDKCARHPGWWYRGMCVDMVGLHNLIGADGCAQYLASQAYKRFPDCGQPLPLKTPNSSIVERQQRSVPSASMWLQSRSLETESIRVELARYKLKKLHREEKRTRKEAKLDAGHHLEKTTGSKRKHRKQEHHKVTALASDE